MSEIATHEPPPDSDFVIRVDLADHGMPGRSEQLWAKRSGPNRFVLRSIPFFAYGLRPGDEVETDDSYSIKRVVRSAGRHVLRIAAVRGQADAVHEDLHPLLEQLGLSHEWHGNGYVAIELTAVELPEPLQFYLEPQAGNGVLHFEVN